MPQVATSFMTPYLRLAGYVVLVLTGVFAMAVNANAITFSYSGGASNYTSYSGGSYSGGVSNYGGYSVNNTNYSNSYSGGASNYSSPPIYVGYGAVHTSSPIYVGYGASHYSSPYNVGYGATHSSSAYNVGYGAHHSSSSKNVGYGAEHTSTARHVGYGAVHESHARYNGGSGGRYAAYYSHGTSGFGWLQYSGGKNNYSGYNGANIYVQHPHRGDWYAKLAAQRRWDQMQYRNYMKAQNDNRGVKCGFTTSPAYCYRLEGPYPSEMRITRY